MNAPDKPTTDLPPTVTLARLYEKQGFLEAAADIYRRLVVREPDNEILKADLEGVEERLREDEKGGGQPRPADVLSILEKWRQAVRWRLNRIFNATSTVRLLYIRVGDGIAEDRPLALKQREDEVETNGLAGKGVTVDTCFCDDVKSLTDSIHRASRDHDALIIHCEKKAVCGEAARQALSSLAIPVIEVDPDNIYIQNTFPTPGIAPAVTAQLVGFGEKSHAIAVRAAADMVRDMRKAGMHVQAERHVVRENIIPGG